MSQEPADPTASSAPPDGTPTTIPSPTPGVQSDAVTQEHDGGPVPGPGADAVTAAGSTDATSAAIVAAVTAAGAEAVVPQDPAVPSAGAGPPPHRGGGTWRAIAGVLLAVLVAAGLGFGGAFLVPALVDVPVPSGAAGATTPAASATPGPTVTVGTSPGPSRSARPTPSPVPVTPRPSSTIYIVQRGDILSAIAARFGVTVQAIVAANGLADPNHIEPGQRLVIPLP